MSDAQKGTAGAEIAALLQELYSEEDARIWLMLPQTILGGEQPIHLIRTGRADKVLTALRQITEGVYV